MIDDGSVAIQMVPTWGPSSTAKLTVLEGIYLFLQFIFSFFHTSLSIKALPVGL